MCVCGGASESGWNMGEVESFRFSSLVVQQRNLVEAESWHVPVSRCFGKLEIELSIIFFFTNQLPERYTYVCSEHEITSTGFSPKLPVLSPEDTLCESRENWFTPLGASSLSLSREFNLSCCVSFFHFFFPHLTELKFLWSRAPFSLGFI